MSSMTKRKFCIGVLCGIPASGKSTLCEQIIGLTDENAHQRFCVSLHINYDSILTNPDSSVYDGSGAWKHQRRQVHDIVEFVIKHLENEESKSIAEMACPEGMDESIWLHFKNSQCLCQITKASKKADEDILLLVDDNMYLRSMRYEFYKLAKSWGAGFCEIMLNPSTDTAMERNALRHHGNRVDQNVVLKMASRIEPPNPLQYPWEKHSLIIDTKNPIQIEKVLTVIKESFADPAQSVVCNEEEQKESQKVTSASLMHQADLILRKCVADTIAESRCAGQMCDRQYSKRLASTKENVLKMLKEGKLQPAECMDEFATNDASRDQNTPFFRYIQGVFKSHLSQMQEGEIK